MKSNVLDFKPKAQTKKIRKYRHEVFPRFDGKGVSILLDGGEYDLTWHLSDEGVEMLISALRCAQRGAASNLIQSVSA